MSRTRHRRKLWQAHAVRLVPRLRRKARALSRLTGFSARELMQEGLLAVWTLSPDDVARSADPIDVQLKAAGCAMSALLVREAEAGGISWDHCGATGGGR